jgi:two-component system cell cycle sensor histidine kinase/response regulator CckA
MTETRTLNSGAGPTDVPPARETLLVVDDEEVVRKLAARMLAQQGYRVLEARHGQEAVRMLRRAAHRIDAVVTDVAMPGIGGRELGATIAHCWPRIRVLYMSGFPARNMVNQGALDPSHPFIQKPFTSEQLARKVRELLSPQPEQ